MGNYLSCTLGTIPGGTRATARVVHPGGEIKIFRDPVTAADLMFEAPNHFLVSAASLRVGSRFDPLPADEELEMGGVYAMFPMKRVGSVVRAGDVGSLFLAAQRRRGGKAAAVRVVPDASSATEEVEKEEMRLEEVVECSSELRCKLKCRSKKPTLATIREECVW